MELRRYITERVAPDFLDCYYRSLTATKTKLEKSTFMEVREISETLKRLVLLSFPYGASRSHEFLDIVREKVIGSGYQIREFLEEETDFQRGGHFDDSFASLEGRILRWSGVNVR